MYWCKFDAIGKRYNQVLCYQYSAENKTHTLKQFCNETPKKAVNISLVTTNVGIATNTAKLSGKYQHSWKVYLANWPAWQKQKIIV